MNVESLGHSRPRGIASAAGVCSCDGADSRRCSCMPPPPPPPPEPEEVEDDAADEELPPTNGSGHRQPALVTGPQTLNDDDVGVESSTGKILITLSLKLNVIKQTLIRFRERR